MQDGRLRLRLRVCSGQERTHQPNYSAFAAEKAQMFRSRCDGNLLSSLPFMKGQKPFTTFYAPSATGETEHLESQSHLVSPGYQGVSPMTLQSTLGSRFLFAAGEVELGTTPIRARSPPPATPDQCGQARLPTISSVGGLGLPDTSAFACGL